MSNEYVTLKISMVVNYGYGIESSVNETIVANDRRFDACDFGAKLQDMIRFIADSDITEDLFTEECVAGFLRGGIGLDWGTTLCSLILNKDFKFLDEVEFFDQFVEYVNKYQEHIKKEEDKLRSLLGVNKSEESKS